MTEHDIFQRSELLLGSEGLSRLRQKRVVLFGVGGVGSWCAEALVRTGLQRLTIVDADRVSASNINRQLMATTETVGQPKVEVLRRRLLTINPQAEVTALERIFSEETADDFGLDGYDYIIDAIDSLRDKAALILRACQTEAQFYASMGAALKIDPTRIRVSEFWKVEGDPLARALRKKFKHWQRFPAKKFLCVYSDELLANRGAQPEVAEPQLFDKPQANGSLVHITAIVGMTLAGLVVRDATAL